MKKKVNGAGTKLDHTEKLKSCKTLLKTISEVIIFFEGHQVWRYITPINFRSLKTYFEEHTMWRYMTPIRPFLKGTECGDI